MFPEKVFVVDGYREPGYAGLIRINLGAMKSIGWFRSHEIAERYLDSLYSERRRFFTIIETTMQELYEVHGYRWCSELGQKRMADPPVRILLGDLPFKTSPLL